jgi:hypothetical protein
MLAIFKSKDGRTIALTLVEDNWKFYLELEPGCRIPLTPEVNNVELGLRLLMSNIYNNRLLVEDIREKIACLGYAELDEFLDRPGLRTLFASNFVNASWSRVQEFARQLNEVIALKTGSQFRFEDIEIEPLDYGSQL